MTRKSFDEDDFVQSVTLQNVSANLDLVRRLERLSLAELGKRTGLSDRHLDSLIRMKSNVSVLVLEQIAERLGIPFLTFIGTRLDTNIPGGWSDFLDSLRDGRGSMNADEEDRLPSPPRIEAETRQQLPSGLTPDLANLLQHLIATQELFAQEQTNLARQVEQLSKAIGGRVAEQVSSLRHSVRSSAGAAGADPSLASSTQPKSGSTRTSTATEAKKTRNQAASRHKPERAASQGRASRKTSSPT